MKNKFISLVSVLCLMLGAFAGVFASNAFAFTLAPNILNTVKSLTVGLNNCVGTGDRYGVCVLSGVENTLKNLKVMKGMDDGFAFDINTNQIGAKFLSERAGLIGSNRELNGFGSVGVLGEAVDDSGDFARGALGFVEGQPVASAGSGFQIQPIQGGASIGGMANAGNQAIDSFSADPVPFGRLFGIYAIAGESQFADLSLGNGHITKDYSNNDDTVVFDDDVELNGNIQTEDLTTETLSLNTDLYNHDATTKGTLLPNDTDQYVNMNDLNSFLGSEDDTKMLFTVYRDNPPSSSGLGTTPLINTSREVTTACPLETVRVACSGYVIGRSPESSTTVYSRLQGVLPYTTSDGRGACRGRYLDDNGQISNMYIEALCIHKNAPANLSTN